MYIAKGQNNNKHGEHTRFTSMYVISRSKALFSDINVIILVLLLLSIFLSPPSLSSKTVVVLPTTPNHSIALAFKPNPTKAAINHPPIAENMNITNKDDLPLAFLLKGADQDADKLTFSIVDLLRN